MTKHVLGFRSSYDADFELYLGADDLQFLIDEGHAAAEFWPGRQFAIFTRHPPRQWWIEKRRYIFGLTDHDLYVRKYGHSMPFPPELGQMIHSFDSLLVKGG